MKFLRNLLIATTAVAAMSATAAFADVVTNTTYDKTAGTVDVVTDLSTYGDQMTVVVIPAAAYDANTITESDILYIDQTASAAGIFQDMGLLNGTALKDGDYYIKVGGTNIAAEGIIVEKFTIATTPAGVTVQLGDTTLDGTVDVSDINPIIQSILGAVVLEGKAALVADTTVDQIIDVSDINPIIQHILGAAELGTTTYTE